MKVRYAERAVRDLTEIGDYLCAQHPKIAETVERRLREAIALLSDFPGIGRRTEDPDIRMFPIIRYPYLVYYEVFSDSVVVHHIRHAARKPLDPRKL
jgi:plasmid stabilization system protein ParE